MLAKTRPSHAFKFQESLFDSTNSDFELQHIANPSIDDEKPGQNFQKLWTATYKNLGSNQEVHGVFCISRGFLAHESEDFSGGFMFLQNLVYARFYTENLKETYGEYRVTLKKDQTVFQLAFYKKEVWESFVNEIKKICICTDFDVRYRVGKLIEEGKKLKTYIVEDIYAKANFTARVFEKKTLIDPTKKRALINEIEALRTLQGRGVFELHELHETENSVYLVTEFVHQDNLFNILNNLNSYLFSKSTVQRIMFSLLKALETMAYFGIIHRNIKPSNILIEDSAKIKITNFGLVTCTSAPVSSFKICGTPGYTAPEVFHGAYDELCDMFSAGCVFFEMLFGYPLSQELFSGNLTFDKVRMADIKKSVYNAVSKVKDRADSEDLSLLFMMLDNEPENRITAEEALKHPYFNTLSFKTQDDEIDDLPQTLDKAKTFPYSHEKVLLIKTNSDLETQCSTNKEEEICEESEANIEYDDLDTFKKQTIRSSKVLPAYH